MFRVEHYSQSLSFKYNEQNFRIKAVILQHIGLFIEKYKKNSVFGISNTSFSTELGKKQQFMTCHSLLQFILLKWQQTSLRK